ncbi:phosphatidylinositol alpha-1,6-mannosyltransferase [Rhizobium sp. RU20A]|uniref:glycosyltransferase family 4 protein n=1 Tax=Rhizobium sp. RU20A TaxID=1907412 RepID=UPI000954D620|nr:glycosyltransferase family 4 protein [Rhizobium sp. RU20A]SIR11720.1 phosphatidylinositol alpha-1,6-mannosyltransferase [Rhizobium sp. RU20A]
MKLLLLSSEFPPRLGGIGTYSLEMAMAACELGLDVTVVAADYGEDQTEKDRNFPFNVIRYPGGEHQMGDIPAKIALVRKIAREAGHFDFVHAADWPFYMPLALSRYRRSAKCVLTFHGTEVTFMQNPKRAILLRLMRFWSGWADYIANSRYTGNLLRAGFNLPDKRVRSIGLGVAESWLEARVDKQIARQERGIPAEKFLIVSLGRVVPRKGHLVLARALALLPVDVLANMQWQIAGPLLDPQYEAEVRAAANDLACETVITGKLADQEVKLTLSSADLFCLPGYFTADGAVEGFGLVYLEAGALGVPSVATNVGGVPDAIDDGETGILVPQNDSAAIAAAILKLYREPDELNRLANGALLRAQRSGWRNVVRQTYQLQSV